MPRYLDPRNDLTFKKIFGEHKDMCISLLNAMLPLGEGRSVTSIEYQTGEMLPRIDGIRNSIVDVRCTDNKGRQFIVEMQMHWTSSFQQRVMLNASKAYIAQFDKGLNNPDPYKLLNPVYALCFVNDIFVPKSEEYYHHYAMVSIANTELRIEGLELVFIELPKFNPKNRAIRKLRDLWLLFPTGIERGAEQVPPELLEEPETKAAVRCLEEHSFTRDELDRYDRVIDSIATEKTLLAGSREDGRAEGRAEGRTEGAREIALAMLDQGLPVEMVAKCSGLAVEEVRELDKKRGSSK